VIETSHPGATLFPRITAGSRSPLSGTRLAEAGFLSPEEHQALAGVISRVRWVGPNIDLVREGDRADTLFIVREGWAYRYATTKDGGRQLPAVLVPGDIANLDSLMFDRLDYGVRTVMRSWIVELPRDRVLALAAKHPGIARTFTWLGLIENAILGKWALSMGRRSAVERLAHLLCELSVRFGAESDDRSRFAFPMTQQQLADVLGLTTVHVNRTMQHLRSEGLIVTCDRTMSLPRVTALRQLAGFDPQYLHMAPPAHARLAQA
jgi:CRP-like cAMP-binding protein